MIDIKILAHPSRTNYVTNLLNKLNLSEGCVVWDDRTVGGDTMYVARKAWNAPIPDGCTHRLVLADDADPCDGFLEIVERIAKKFDKHAVTLFHTQGFEDDERYHPCNRLWGIAIMLPTELIKPCWDYIDYMIATPEYYPPCNTRNDDFNIKVWARENNIPMIETNPALVQHLGETSLVGCKRFCTAPDFTKHPPTTGW